MFNSWHNIFDRSAKDHLKKEHEKRIEMYQRADTKVYLSVDNRGKSFVEDVLNGKRLYRLRNEITLERTINAWLQALGVLLFTMGIMGFVLEQRAGKP